MNEKPVAKLIGEDGNIFNLVGIACKALRGAGLYDQEKELRSRIWDAASYDDALCMIMEYVEVE